MNISELFKVTGEEECMENLERDSCRLSSSQTGVVDAIAAIRMIAAALSFIGATSIISISIAKKHVFSTKVHPIFILSVADLLLSILWIIGGGVWLRRLKNRVWCYAISLPTIILECISVNLTTVYALLAYSSAKKKDLNTLLQRENNASEQVWHPAATAAAYITAWLLPMIIVMVQFGVVAGQTNLVTNANKCSCWCIPVYGNVLPLAGITENVSNATRRFIYNVNILIATYGFVLGTHYLVGFILLVVIYTKLLSRIKRIRNEFEQIHYPGRQYGATGILLVTGQSKAKRRVLAFLTVFVMTGILNFILSYMYVIVEATVLPAGPNKFSHSKEIITAFNMILGLQSFIVPMQGFLNAIVYGWTREDFAQLLAFRSTHHDGWDVEVEDDEHNDTPAPHSESQVGHQSSLTRCDAEENSIVPDDSAL